MAAVAQRVEVPVQTVEASAFCVPTDAPESDGTLEWGSTTLVLVEISAGDEVGLGWTYTSAAAAQLVNETLGPLVAGRNALDVGGATRAMRVALRNIGYPGLGAMAASAVDIAFWDLKAKLLELPLASLLGPVRDGVPVYGSGGFCSYSDERLAEQLSGWVAEGIPRVKMKVGREPGRDVARVGVAREAIGEDSALFVDANGAFTAKDALDFADAFSHFGVSWFEEPVSSDDLDGLRIVRERAPAGMDIAAGEYASTPADIRGLIGAVDCLQADVTRCGGVTGVLAAAALAEAHQLDLSGHTAPAIHSHVLSAIPRLRHLEWFHDHVRVERLLFDGLCEPHEGVISFDRSRPGLGIELKRADAARYEA